MDFENEFALWLENGLDVEIPEGIRGFSFNLFEPARIPGVKFGIEIIEAATFDEEDPDWTYDEIWEPSIRQLAIPLDFSGDKWKVCLDRMKELVVNYLKSNTNATRKLKSVEGVGLGFIDGDLEIVWKS